MKLFLSDSNKVLKRVKLNFFVEDLKEDQKIKGLFSSPDFDILIKRNKTSSVKILEELHLISKKYPLTLKIFVEIHFLEGNSYKIIDKGVSTSIFLLSVIEKDENETDFIKISSFLSLVNLKKKK